MLYSKSTIPIKAYLADSQPRKSLTLITWECLCSKIREVVTSTAEKGSACKQCTAGQENIEAAHKPCVGSLPGEALAHSVLVVWGLCWLCGACAGCVGG